MQPVHPGWCDPRYCSFTDIDVQHRSTPTLLSTCEHEWWFTLARADEWAHIDQHGDTELLIDVHNTVLRVPDVQHVLRAQEIGLYANRLLVERHRAHHPCPRHHDERSGQDEGTGQEQGRAWTLFGH